MKGEDVEGWKWLPRICLKAVSANSFIFSRIIELSYSMTTQDSDQIDRKFQNDGMLPWLKLITKCIHLTMWK